MINNQTYCIEKARAWMKAAHISDLQMAKALIKTILSFGEMSSENPVTLCAGGASVTFTDEHLQGAKEVRRGINLMIKNRKKA